MISCVITAFNEGDEVHKTVASIREHTTDVEIVIVDDGSTDGCCDNVHVDKLIRHDDRRGIALSRNEGAAEASGDVLAFLDGHHRLTPGCLNKCADVSRERSAIAWPCVRGLEDKKKGNWTGHGALMRQSDDKKKRGLFSLKWRTKTPRDKVSRCSTMVVPGYLMTRDVYNQVRWIDGLKGWGASEPAVTVKAFFLDIDILHVCGPMCRHYFRPGLKIPYPTPWKAVARNHALVARICFDDLTWRNYWVPKVFSRWLGKDDLAEFDSGPIVRQYEDFQSRKKRPDSEFWRGQLQIELPGEVAK